MGNSCPQGVEDCPEGEKRICFKDSKGVKHAICEKKLLNLMNGVPATSPDTSPAASPDTSPTGINIPIQFGKHDQIRNILQEFINEENVFKCQDYFYRILDSVRESMLREEGQNCDEIINTTKNLPVPHSVDERVIHYFIKNKFIPFLENNREIWCEDGKVNHVPVFDEIAQANCPDYKPGTYVVEKTLSEGYYGGIRSLKFELVMIILLILLVTYTLKIPG